MEFEIAGGIGAPPRYVKRAIAEAVAGATAPVAVLEGAHGVGKTALVKNEDAFRCFRYVSLGDEEEFSRASARPAEWAAQLPRPVVIDDAHLIPDLLALVRQTAPQKRGQRPAFVLLSPERLRSEKMPGPKPARFTLFPLTQAEICGRPGCIVDDLFDGTVVGKFHSLHTRSDLRTKMRIGGFPYRVLHPARALSQEGENGLPFQDELRIMREEDVGPDTSIDELVGRLLLRKTLTNPGISLGIDTLARACSVDPSTLTDHLESLRRRFLIHRLIMLDRQQSSKYAFAKTRVHPIDTALAVEALHEDGCDITADPAVFSGVLKTLCVNQLVPAVQWAGIPTDFRHWKKFDRRMREVDLVLVRGERFVGITVRNSIAARHDTIGALRFLAEDERFARGFIVYMGPFPRQLTENIWAIPVSALWESAAFLPCSADAGASADTCASADVDTAEVAEVD